jgi:MFS family permease
MPPSRLPGTLRVLLAASFVSSIGGGLTLPFLVIYLHQVRHIPLGISGLLIGGVAALALPLAPWAGALVDRFGARIVLLVALVVEGLGIASLVTVHNSLTAVPAMVLYGLGQAAGWPTWNALLGVMVEDDTISRLAFARNFQLLNLGLGIGAVIGGLVVHVRQPGTFVAVYLIDGTSNLIVVAALALLPKTAFGSERDRSRKDTVNADTVTGIAGGKELPGGYRAVFADRLFRRYALTLTVLMVAGYAAINTGFVAFATSVAKAGPGTIAISFAANTSLIVVTQPLALRLCAKMRRTTALQAVAAAFAVSWVVLAVAGLTPGTGISRVLVIATPAVFGVGEVLLSPVNGPLVNDLAPQALRGRYFAASAMCFTLAALISPAVSGAMIGAGLGLVLLLFFVAACGGAAIGAQWLNRCLTPAQDNAPESRPHPPHLSDSG